MDFSLFYSDGLHLVERSNLKLGKSVLKAIDSNSNANPYKNAVCFDLNECDFPSLPSPATRSKPPVKYVGPCSVPVSISHRSLYQPVVTSAPCFSPVRMGTATFPSHIPNICYTNAAIRSFSSKFKTTS